MEVPSLLILAARALREFPVATYHLDDSPRDTSVSDSVPVTLAKIVTLQKTVS